MKDELLPSLIEKTNTLHASHKARWFDLNKRQGWACLDIRYSGVKGRCETAIEELTAYLSGEISKIEELEDERLSYPVPAIPKYAAAASPTHVI